MTTNHIKNDRKSPRARWFDYNSGLYFVTVCTRNRDHFFGDVIDGEMQLNEIGRYANLQFQNVMTHYPYAEIPVWIVMPNHIHAIVAIQRRHWNGCRDVCRSGCRDDVHIVPTSMAMTVPTSTAIIVPTTRWKNRSVDEQMQQVSQRRGLLSTTIGGLKRAVTQYANENGIPFAWQPRFHDHIIRNPDELYRIAKYIRNNPANWETDCLY
jgi:REP element-mobilizing transposase RayT